MNNTAHTIHTRTHQAFVYKVDFNLIKFSKTRAFFSSQVLKILFCYSLSKAIIDILGVMQVLPLFMCTLQKLEKLLPKRPKVDIPMGDDVEEVDLVEFEDTRGGRGRREAYDDDDDDDEHGHGGPRVQCAHQ